MCACEKLKNKEYIRRTLRAGKPLATGLITMKQPWLETVTPEGEMAVAAEFFCDTCKGTLIVMLVQKEDPADWWKR